MARANSAIFDETAKGVLAEIRGALHELQQGIRNWFSGMLEYTPTGEYYMNYSVVNTLSRDALDAAKALRTARDNVREIAGRMHYNSYSGAYYRSKLSQLADSLDRDFKKAQSLAEATDECIRACMDGDNRGAACYSRL